eukprot:687370-Prymnesium_polylepis.2
MPNDEKRTIVVKKRKTHDAAVESAPDKTEMPTEVSADARRSADEPGACVKAWATCVRGSSISPTETISTTLSTIDSVKPSTTISAMKSAMTAQMVSTESAATRALR